MENHSSQESYPVSKFTEKAIIVKECSYLDKHTLVLSKHYQKYIDKIVLSRGMILERIDKLAQDITRDYFDKDVVLLVIMKGAVVFGSDLSEKITEILNNDITDSYTMTYCIEYVTVSSYVDDKSTGQVKIKMDERIQNKLKGRNVLIVEDIYDSGLSMFKLNEYLSTLGVLDIRSTVLFQKMNNEHIKYNYEVNYLGFLIPDSFVIGFGMDYNEEFRQLSHLCIISQEGIEMFRKK